MNRQKLRTLCQRSQGLSVCGHVSIVKDNAEIYTQEIFYLGKNKKQNNFFLKSNWIQKIAKPFSPVHMGPSSNLLSKKMIENLVTLSL